MQIALTTEGRVVVTHGSAGLLVTFAVLSAALAWGLTFLVMHLGWANEPVAYTTLALAACGWGLLATRLVRFDFDGARRRLLWRRRGVIPASGEVPFEQIQKATLDTRTDRRGTPFYRIVLQLAGGGTLLITAGRTRDLYRCLDVLDLIAGVLGHPRLADLLAAGRTDDAARLAEERHGVPPDRAQAYFSWRDRHPAAPPSGPACAP
jgi:hypothetical protein